MKIENTDAEQIERLNGRIAELLRERDEAKERGDRYHAENDVLFKRAVEAESRAGNAQQPLRDKADEAAMANVKEAWAALAMIREAVETLGPSGAMKASEHLDGPTFTHEADALVGGIIVIASMASTVTSTTDRCEPPGDCDWPNEPFTFHDNPGEHDPCYVVMPGGAMIPLNHHAGEGVDIARAKFIITACNAALSPDFSRKAVGEAMQDAWNEICSDTGCHPLDIEHQGKKLLFNPGHWVSLTAKLLFVNWMRTTLSSTDHCKEPK